MVIDDAAGETGQDRPPKVVRHGRYVTFQLAEVAVPKDLFRKILRLIDVLVVGIVRAEIDPQILGEGNVQGAKGQRDKADQREQQNPPPVTNQPLAVTVWFQCLIFVVGHGLFP